jgi:hypothetical protein
MLHPAGQRSHQLGFERGVKGDKTEGGHRKRYNELVGNDHVFSVRNPDQQEKPERYDPRNEKPGNSALSASARPQ